MWECWGFWKCRLYSFVSVGESSHGKGGLTKRRGRRGPWGGEEKASLFARTNTHCTSHTRNERERERERESTVKEALLFKRRRQTMTAFSSAVYLGTCELRKVLLLSTYPLRQTRVLFALSSFSLSFGSVVKRELVGSSLDCSFSGLYGGWGQGERELGTVPKSPFMS